MGRLGLLGILLAALSFTTSGCGSSSVAYRETSGSVWLVRDNAFYRTLLDSNADELRQNSQGDEVERVFDPEQFLNQIMKNSRFKVATFAYIREYSTKPIDGIVDYNASRTSSYTTTAAVSQPALAFDVECEPYYVHYPQEIDPHTGIVLHDSLIPVEATEETTASEYEFRFNQNGEHWEMENLQIIIRIDKLQLDAAMQQLFAVPIVPRFRDGSPAGFDNLVELEKRLPVYIQFEYFVTIDGLEYTDAVSREYNLGISPG